MRSVFSPAAALSLLTFCSPANDRHAGETGMATDTTAHAAADTGASAAEATTPTAILTQLYAANTAEIQVAKLAQKQASSPAVKKIAAKLASDHAKNREEERALAQKLSLSLTVSPADGATVPPELQGKAGREFDRAFLEDQIKAHEQNIEKLQTQLLPAASNPEVKAYLQKTLAAMQGHLASLKQVQQQLG